MEKTKINWEKVFKNNYTRDQQGNETVSWERHKTKICCTRQVGGSIWNGTIKDEESCVHISDLSDLQIASLIYQSYDYLIPFDFYKHFSNNEHCENDTTEHITKTIDLKDESMPPDSEAWATIWAFRYQNADKWTVILETEMSSNLEFTRSIGFIDKYDNFELLDFIETFKEKQYSKYFE